MEYSSLNCKLTLQCIMRNWIVQPTHLCMLAFLYGSIGKVLYTVSNDIGLHEAITINFVHSSSIYDHSNIISGPFNNTSSN